ncbi:MAG TPA: hypothetical protein ENK05_12355 [Gammaproteobacteria bacterium]|nr:hypothetical protein [Gammaproteobacteria bacterium]
MHIFDQCRDPYGRLSEARKTLLQRLMEEPDQCLWERARGLIIRAVPIVTLETAVRSVCRNFDAKGVPDPFTLYRALRFAVDYEESGSHPEHGGICRK